ncbi:hypothetical protein [Segetibacter koreensis]|nr:hypothetical protein [Segetibacter koreensis]
MITLTINAKASQQRELPPMMLTEPELGFSTHPALIIQNVIEQISPAVV